MSFQHKILQLIFSDHRTAFNLFQFDIIEVVHRLRHLNHPPFRGMHGKGENRLRRHIGKLCLWTIGHTVVNLNTILTLYNKNAQLTVLGSNKNMIFLLTNLELEFRLSNISVESLHWKFRQLFFAIHVNLHVSVENFMKNLHELYVVTV